MHCLSTKWFAQKVYTVSEDQRRLISKKLGIPLEKIGVTGQAMIVTETVNENVVKSARNLPGVVTTIATILSPYEVLKARSLVVDKAALAKIEEVYC